MEDVIPAADPRLVDPVDPVPVDPVPFDPVLVDLVPLGRAGLDLGQAAPLLGREAAVSASPDRMPSSWSAVAPSIPSVSRARSCIRPVGAIADGSLAPS